MTNFNDTFIYSLIVTLFGMGIVFIVLVALQYILKSMKVVFYKEKSEDGAVTQIPEARQAETVMPQVNNTEAADDELAAVIAAALMSCMGSRSNIVVRNIRRVDDVTPVWGKVSRTEQMANRFN